jgi:hypothetical protein
MRGPNLAELLDPVLEEMVRRFDLPDTGWHENDVAGEKLLSVLPPELASELRLREDRGEAGRGETLIVLASAVVVELDSSALTADQARRLGGPTRARKVELVDSIEWVIVRLDRPLEETEDDEIVPGQTGEVLAALGWAPATSDVSDNWIGDVLFDLGLYVLDADDFELRGNP